MELMETIVNKIKPIVIFIILINQIGLAQNRSIDNKYSTNLKSTKSNFAYFKDIKLKGKQHSYSDLAIDLSSNLPIPKNIECKFLTELFVFKVNKIGEIDFIRSYGNLEDSTRNKIILNLKNTKGHWYISRKEKFENHFFVFPFISYNVNSSKKCNSGNEFNEIKEFIMQLYDTNSLLLMLLPPSKNITILPHGEHKFSVNNNN